MTARPCIALGVALALVAAAACGRKSPTEPSDPTPPAGPVTIRGAVRDFTTGMPRGAARLQFTADSGGAVTTALANASGVYEITVPAVGSYTVLRDDVYAGTLQVTGPSYAGDLLLDTGTCVSRYGVLTDARTTRPVAGATVALPQQAVTSGVDGSYRIDLGCEPNFSFSTSFITVTHPAYQQRQQVVGRGVHNVVRLDLVLEPN